MTSTEQTTVSPFIAAYQKETSVVCWRSNKAGTVCMKVQKSELGPLIVQYAKQAPWLQLSCLAPGGSWLGRCVNKSLSILYEASLDFSMISTKTLP